MTDVAKMPEEPKWVTFYRLSESAYQRRMATDYDALRAYAQSLLLNRERDELIDALRELLGAMLELYPTEEAGNEAQDAWADRRFAAINNASFLLAKHSHPNEAAQTSDKAKDNSGFGHLSSARK